MSELADLRRDVEGRLLARTIAFLETLHDRCDWMIYGWDARSDWGELQAIQEDIRFYRRLTDEQRQRESADD